MTKNYTLIPLPDGVESMTRVMLKVAPYDGVIFQYGKVSFNPSSDELQIDFEYQVFENPNNENTESKEFRDVIFEILVELIQKSCE